MKNFQDTLDLPKIGQTQNDTLTRDISIEEVVEAINRYKKLKSPGSDVYPVEWYKTFKDVLSPLLVKSFNWT